MSAIFERRNVRPKRRVTFAEELDKHFAALPAFKAAKESLHLALEGG